ncbi:hypothetical protein HZA39_02130, partial [Candidatus Peregrinibacteria bacterium]|nr:hypothetical protein [Candidatus Peregrinibacteria bacterium]
LEADGRLEMCSKPRTSLHDLAHEFRFYNHEITEVSKIFGIAHLGIGVEPFHKSDEVSFCPKARYSILKKFYKNSSALCDWLKIVNGIHVNFDYTSEQDAIRKSQLMWRASSILAAMFAFSPIQNNKPAEYLDTRLTITNKFDSSRTNLHKEFLRKDFSFKKWLDFCLDQKIFYIMREGKPIYPKKTFREFIEKGVAAAGDCPRIFPTIRDFNLHLKSIWLEIRIRKYIEFRAIDSVPPFLVMAGPALVKGLLYSEESMAAVEKLIGDLSFEELMQLREDVIKENLQAPLRKKKVLDYAKELLTIASDNLKSFKNLNEKGEDESVYLEPLKEFVLIKEKSPARYVLEKWQGEWDKSPAKLIEWCTAETRPA